MTKEYFLSSDYNAMNAILSDDVTLIMVKVKEGGEEVWKRSYVRAVFSSIEAIVATIKQGIRNIQKVDHLPLSEDQQKKLDAYFLIQSKKGILKKRFVRLSFAENVAFAFDLLAYSAHIFSKIDRTDEGWRNLIECSKLRNRIMHPTKPSDILITRKELYQVHRAYQWVIDTWIYMLDISQKKMIAELEGLKKAQARLTKRS